VVVDGVPVAAAAEERLNRVWHYAGFRETIGASRHGRPALQRRDAVATAPPRREPRREAKYVLSQPTKLLNLAKIGATRRALDDARDLLVRHCSADPAAMRFNQYNVEHHIAHTASAYFASPWDHAAGLTVDGSGDFCTSMLSECEGDDIRVKHRVYVPNSFGSLYTMVCEFIGYGTYGDEGKVMGLAPYGRDNYAEHFAEMVDLGSDGLKLNPRFFVPVGANQGMRITAKARWSSTGTSPSIWRIASDHHG
jgi:carbamoyltransferase